MLSEVVNAFDLPRGFWAELIGCSPMQLDEWLAGQREVPMSVAALLSKAIGVPRDAVLSTKHAGAEKMLPPMWLKAREDGLGATETKAIAMTRLLAAKYDEVLHLLDPGSSDNYELLLIEIRSRTDVQSPAAAQGKSAAAAFLDLAGLAKTRRGIGEVFRGALRSRGLLILETPINNPKLEGFCVPVGPPSRTRACLVANSYKTTWFRRNYILLHELAHVIFDLEAATAVYDVDGGDEGSRKLSIAEERADAFAMHALLPKDLLVSVENRGLKLSELNKESLAQAIADTHAEKRLIARAAHCNDLISDAEAERIANIQLSNKDLASVTYHAKGLASLNQEQLFYPEVVKWADRMTTFPIRGLRLPIPFVRLVLDALKESKITANRAAELLMVTTEELSRRYGVSSESVA